jgi:hypothetical protein
MLALFSGVAGAAPPAGRVKDLGRFPRDPRENPGAWILEPALLPALPGDASCAAAPDHRPSCKLTELATLGGSQWFWFRQDRVIDDGLRTSEGSLIEVTPDRRIQAVWGIQLAGEYVSDAVLLHKPGAVLLHVPVRYSGTGAYRDDFLFRWKGTYWQEVDTASWKKAITLPPCYGLWKGPFLEFETLTLDMPVWIDGDGNCCPTGGTLKVKFALEGDVLEVTEWHHVRSENDGNPSDSWRRIDAAKCGAKPK